MTLLITQEDFSAFIHYKEQEFKLLLMLFQWHVCVFIHMHVCVCVYEWPHTFLNAHKINQDD